MKTPDVSIRRILVREDELVVGVVCQRVLAAEGFAVDIALSAEAAQDMLVKKDYDLCLFDIRMPEMDSIRLYQWLQENNKPLAERVIFMTGDMISPDTQDLLEKSRRSLLLKPFI